MRRDKDRRKRQERRRVGGNMGPQNNNNNNNNNNNDGGGGWGSGTQATSGGRGPIGPGNMGHMNSNWGNNNNNSNTGNQSQSSTNYFANSGTSRFGNNSSNSNQNTHNSLNDDFLMKRGGSKGHCVAVRNDSSDTMRTSLFSNFETTEQNFGNGVPSFEDSQKRNRSTEIKSRERNRDGRSNVGRRNNNNNNNNGMRMTPQMQFNINFGNTGPTENRNEGFGGGSEGSNFNGQFPSDDESPVGIMNDPPPRSSSPEIISEKKSSKPSDFPSEKKDKKMNLSNSKMSIPADPLASEPLDIRVLRNREMFKKPKRPTKRTALGKHSLALPQHFQITGRKNKRRDFRRYRGVIQRRKRKKAKNLRSSSSRSGGKIGIIISDNSLAGTLNIDMYRDDLKDDVKELKIKEFSTPFRSDSEDEVEELPTGLRQTSGGEDDEIVMKDDDTISMISERYAPRSGRSRYSGSSRYMDSDYSGSTTLVHEYRTDLSDVYSIAGVECKENYPDEIISDNISTVSNTSVDSLFRGRKRRKITSSEEEED